MHGPTFIALVARFTICSPANRPTTAEAITAKLLAHQRSPIPELRKIRDDVPTELETVFKKMVAKSVADRYQSMNEVIAALEQCRTGQDTSASIEPSADTGYISDKVALAEAKSPQAAGSAAQNTASEDEKERLAKQQANVAAALLRTGKSDSAWPLLRFTPDPRSRSYLIHWISTLGVDPQAVVKRFGDESDVTIRRALVLTLGKFTDAQFPLAQREPLIEKLLALYESEPDSGLHAAAEWLLRKWEQSNRLKSVVEKLRGKENQLLARMATEKRRWYVNTQGQTFAILDAGEFLMGSPESEPGRQPVEIQHRCRIGRRLAVSAKQVTKAQFARFQTARPDIKRTNTAQWVKTDNSPQVSMTWYEAAAYCNWLSEQEGIVSDEWCYEPNEKGAYGPGMKTKRKYLELSGYRLPTEAEWEYACRAGTVTSRYYGLSDTLLAQYAWYEANGQNRTWPVGSLKPNDFGLFDMHGNAWDWCDDSYQDYPAAADSAVNDSGSNVSASNDSGSSEPVVEHGKPCAARRGIQRSIGGCPLGRP